MSNVQAIVLDEYRGLFKDEQSFKDLKAAFVAALSRSDMPPVISENELLFTAVSPDCTKELLYERILSRFASNPSQIAKLEDRLRNDEIVE